jgi:hypothetical protein
VPWRSPGYGTVDHFPQTETAFDDLLGKLKAAGYNVIHCVYRDWRIPICRKHGVKMMIDVLAWQGDALTDIRREAQQPTVKALCEKVRNESAVWGYNLWNERLDYFGRPGDKGINDYLAMLREWDPTHPVWVGTYRNYYPQTVTGNPGVFAYYDYHWQRGMDWHFANLSWYQGLLNDRNAWLGRWMMVSDYNRNSYTLNTSLAFGLKVGIWFIGGPWSPKTGQWNPNYHTIHIGRDRQRLWPELMKIGRPITVFSTATTKTPDNKVKPPGVPKHLKPFPTDYWLQVKCGEVVVGFFKYPSGDDALYVANHNAFQEQRVVLAGAPRLSLFDRATGLWQLLPVENGTVAFALPAAGGELLRVEKSGT